MNWIKRIVFLGTEKEQLNRLAVIAEAEHLFDEADFEILLHEIGYSPGKSNREELANKYREELPDSPREKFQLSFSLVKRLMSNGGLSDGKEKVAYKLIQAMDLSREKARELVSFIIMNIRNGLSLDDSYDRLGYLLETSKYI